MHCDCKESLLYYCYVRILRAEGTESVSLAVWRGQRRRPWGEKAATFQALRAQESAT